MAKRKRKRKPKKPRDLNAMMMILACKGGPMKHRCERRGGARNVKREILADD
jgi:hypothetical protein